MIVAVAHSKGGVGKTTLAYQLAVSWAIAGRTVLLIDADRQGSAQLAAAERAGAGRQPALRCIKAVEGPELRAAVQRHEPDHDALVIDAGGRDSTALRAALLLADLVLVPFLPRALDVWALADIAELVEQAKAARRDDRLRVRAVMNGADPVETSNSADALASLADYPDLVLLDTPVRRRVAFANAMRHGLSVDELMPRDPKAVNELNAMASAVQKMVKSNGKDGASSGRTGVRGKGPRRQTRTVG